MVSFSRALLVAVPFVVIAACSSSSSDDPGVVNPDGMDNGAQCQVASDCKSGACTANKCIDGMGMSTNVPASHSDGNKNLDETDIDCGGSAPKCASGKACILPADCATATCLKNVCRDPSAKDGVKNAKETDVDCGGPDAPPCDDGKGCAVATDCSSGVCPASKKCAVPTSTDSVKNGDETDVDCGGTTTSAKACAVGKSCKAHSDCTSDGCDYKGTCIAIRSCTQQHGGDTCGPGELAAGHESCCTTIAGSPVDKYNITAGRMRVFAERTNGNMRAFAQAYTGTWWNHAWDQNLPTMLDSGGTDPDFTGVYQELGPIVHPPGATGANEGCFVTGYGARTFRIPDAVNTRMGDAQEYTQDVLDEKALNCTDAYIIAAFCAWDGGRMPTRAEWNAAWGSGTYPWTGNVPPAGWPQAYDTDATGFAFAPPSGDVKLANFTYNYWGPPAKVAHDYSLYIAPPGRFPKGNSPAGHADMAASVFNFESITGTNVNWSKSGSWQGHQVPYPDLTTAATNKYWATGGRCARD